MDMQGLENVQFGDSMKKEFFLKEQNVHLNHGAVPRRVHEYRIKLQKKLEENPDLWFCKESKAAVCKFVAIKDTNCMVFVENATTGTNAVLKSLKFSKGDIVLGTSLTYQAVKNLVNYIGETRDGVESSFLEISLPIKSKDYIIHLYREFLNKNNNVKIAVIDYITSPSVILMPVKEIVEVCRQYGVLTLIDGAHSPGQIELNIDELGADFYVGNLHKWLYVPRGCTILYVAKQHTEKIHTLNSSYCLYQGLNAEFLKNGTRDYTPFFCAEAGINFFKAIGGFEKVNKYNKPMIRKGSEYLMKLWGTGKQEIPDAMEAPFMINVKLPPLVGFGSSRESLLKLKLQLLDEQVIVSSFVTYLGVNYCRLSCQVYNTMDDYIKLGQAVKQLMI